MQEKMQKFHFGDVHLSKIRENTWYSLVFVKML